MRDMRVAHRYESVVEVSWWKILNIQSCGQKASVIVAHKHTTSSFGLKIRIEKIGKNRKVLLSVVTDTWVTVREKKDEV